MIESDPVHRTIVQLIKARAVAYPDRVAFWTDRSADSPLETISYDRLYQRALGIACQLSACFEPRDRVVLLFADPLEYLLGVLACQLGGVICVSGLPPFPPRLAGSSARQLQRLQRVLSVIENSSAAGILGAPAIVRDFQRAFEATGISTGLKWLCPDDSLGSHIALNVEPRPADIALVQYTSGSTGVPSGVVVSHANLIANLAAHQAAFALGPEDVGVSWLPFYHDLGLIGSGLLPLFANFPCALMPSARFSQNPLRWLELIDALKATVSWAPNFAYDECVEKVTEQQLRHLNLSSWRTGMNAAEPVLQSTVSRFANRFSASGYAAANMTPCYGLAEATLLVTACPLDAAPTSLRVLKGALAEGRVVIAGSNDSPVDCVEVVCCGKAVSGVAVEIVSARTLKSCPDSIVGEIWIAGSSVAGGYLNQPDRTAQIFNARLNSGEGPFLRTGDLGFVVEGNLYVCGRLKDVVIIHGANFYAHELERTAEASHPALRPNASAAFPIENGGKEAVGIVCEIQRGSHNFDEVASAVRRALFEDWRINPQVVALVPAGAVLKTPSGKIQRRLCKTAYLSGSLQILSKSELSEAPGDLEDYREPASKSSLAEWIAAQLRIAPSASGKVGHLADLGINSLRIAKLAHAIERRYSLRVELAELFDQSTFENTVSYVERLIVAPPKPTHSSVQYVSDQDQLDRRSAGILRMKNRKQRKAES